MIVASNIANHITTAVSPNISKYLFFRNCNAQSLSYYEMILCNLQNLLQFFSFLVVMVRVGEDTRVLQEALLKRPGVF